MTQKRQTPDLESALVGRVQGAGVLEAASFENRIARYTKAGKRSRLVGRYLLNHCGLSGPGLFWDRPEAFKLGQKVTGCASVLCFRHYLKVDERRLLGAITCQQHYLCEFCAIRRAAKSMAAYMQRLQKLMSDDPTLKPYMLTLTVKNGFDLKERFDHLVSCKDKLRQAFNNKKKGMSHGSLFGLFVGGVCSIEITYSAEYGWHPHMHVLLLGHDSWEKSQFSDAKKNRSVAFKDTYLSQEWHDITGDSFIVDLTEIEKDPETGSYAGGCAEVFKYALKMTDLDLEKQVEAFFTLRGNRMVFAFGQFWGVKVPEELTDDPIEGETEYVDLIYKWFACGYQHVKTIRAEQQQDLWGNLTYDQVVMKKEA